MKKLYPFLLLCVACAPQTDVFGFENLEYESQHISIKKDDKSSVLSKMGLPNSMSFDHNTWYYVYFEKASWAFFPAKIKNDMLLKLKFDKKNTLIEKTLIPHFLKKQKMVKDITPIERSAKKDNYLFEILENITNVGTDSQS